MNLILIGTNHNIASVNIREQISFNEKKSVEAMKKLLQNKNITGIVILSTCNRVELYCSVKKINSDELLDFLKNFHNINIDNFKRYFYIYQNQKVISHLVSVAAGLDSMLIGEPQIFGQVKAAYKLSLEANTISKELNTIFQRAIYITKKVRTETGIGRGAVTISHAVIECIKNIYTDIADLKVMLIGGGKMAEICAKHFSNNNSNLLISNRSLKKSNILAKKYNGEIVGFETRFTRMIETDVVIVSTSAPHYVIKKERIAKLMNALKNKKIIFIDISVPRNIDPVISGISNIILYNIDDLKTVINNNLNLRYKKVNEAKIIIKTYA